jgi:peroxiredoxin
MKSLLRLSVVGVLVLACSASLLAADAKKKKRGADGRVDLASELPADAQRLAIGDAAPDFRIKGTDGRTYTLADFRASPLLMVVFLSNHCPYSHAAETRLIPLAKEFAAKGLAVVAINPNSPDAVTLSELGYGKYNDSFDESVLYAKEQGFPFPYLYDGDTQTTAKAYGCLATPHVFLFDRERKLRYTGRVDDSRFEDPGTVTSHDARDAVVALLDGQPVRTPTTPVVGCATKWKSKAAEVARLEASAKNEPVVLERASAEAIAKLVRGESKRLRVVNVWATWCAPCVAEFPELVVLSRRFANRDFELITISMDAPKQEPQVQRFLEKNGAAPSNRLRRQLAAEGRTTTHYLYDGASTDALVKAVDPEWPGPLPHTVVIAPDGKVIYRHNGAIDPARLLEVVLGALGGFYR